MGIFDILGPVMIGPSSSHTAGAVRIGNIARVILNETPVRAEIGLHGSFSATGKGHGTDIALVGGILGFTPDDPRIRDAREWAVRAGFTYQIDHVDLGDEMHPNAARIALYGETGKKLEIVGISVGGGEIEIIEIDGFSLRLTGEYDSLIASYNDRPGVIAKVSSIIAKGDINIAQMTVRRRDKGEEALMVVEVDQPLPEEVAIEVMSIPEMRDVRNVLKVSSGVTL